MAAPTGGRCVGFDALIGSKKTAFGRSFCLEAAPLLTDPQIAFANAVVAATKNRLAEGRAIAGMRYGELRWRRRARRSIENGGCRRAVSCCTALSTRTMQTIFFPDTIEC